MFKTLGLLAKLVCPDHVKGECEPVRPFCPLSHQKKPAASSSSSLSSTSPNSTSKQKTDSLTVQPVKRSAEPSAGASVKRAIDGPPPLKKAKNAYIPSSNRTAASTSSSLPSHSNTNASSSKAQDGWTTVSLKPPTLSFQQHPKKLDITLSQRQAVLKVFYQAFIDIYSAFFNSQNLLVRNIAQIMAHDHALAQELELTKEANKHSYTSSSRSLLMGLKKRDKKVLEEYAAMAEKAAAAAAASESESHDRQTADKIKNELNEILAKCPEVGTATQVKAKRAEAETRREGKLSRERLAHAGFILPKGDLEKYEFMAMIPDEWQTEAGVRPDSVGDMMECERCGNKFEVGGKMNPNGTERIGQDPKECGYHWGKRKYEKVSDGDQKRVLIWLCCGKRVESTALGGASCCYGPHVFKETNPLDLHKREPFITTRDLIAMIQKEEGERSTSPLDIIALDCELSYTTSGLSLTRLTMIQEDGTVILDELVRTKADIVDYNTRFSGIQPKEYEEKAILDLPAVRKAAARFIGENTILIGHGLENDLRALRLVHTKIVDTAVLFPHPKGYPFKMSLRDLTSKHLGKIIQSSGASVGHSSAEDATVALDLVRWKIIHDPTNPFSGLSSSSSTTTTTTTTVTGVPLSKTTNIKVEASNKTNTVVTTASPSQGVSFRQSLFFPKSTISSTSSSEKAKKLFEKK